MRQPSNAGSGGRPAKRGSVVFIENTHAARHPDRARFADGRAKSLFDAAAPPGDYRAGRRQGERTMDTLVDTDWLSKHLGEPDLVVLDCTVVTEMDGGRGNRRPPGVNPTGRGSAAVLMRQR